MAAGSGRREEEGGERGGRERACTQAEETTGEKKLWKREVGRGCGVVGLPD